MDSPITRITSGRSLSESRISRPQSRKYDRIVIRTASASSDTSDSDRLEDPSQYHARQGYFPKGDHAVSKLAFTTDELQLNSTSSSKGKSPSTRTLIKGRRGRMSSAGTGTTASVNSSTMLNQPKSTTLLNENVVRAKPTVTTILRQQHVLEVAERKERAKLDQLVISNAVLFDADYVAKEKVKKDEEEAKAAEAKRLINAKLAYERAKAASRKVLDEKRELAESTRQKTKEWQIQCIEKQRAETEMRKNKTEYLQRTTSHSRQAMDEMLKVKQMKAAKLKQEMELIKLEAKQKKQQEDILRHNKIQQIQACKIALKKTKESMGNPNQFLRTIAIPETQIKLRLQKEEEKRRLEETRKKIQEMKQSKSVKLIRAMKKIQSFEKFAAKKQISDESFNPPKKPSSFNMLTSLNNISKQSQKSETKLGELDKMLQELKELKQENFKKKQTEDSYRRARSVSTNSVRIIGASKIAPKSNISGSKTSTFYNPNESSTPEYKKRLGILTLGKE